MKYLLDTHAMVWSLTDTARLSPEVRKLLENPNNIVAVSAVSFWEIAVKYSLGKLDLVSLSPDDFYQACLKTGFEPLELPCGVSSSSYRLPKMQHKDPFDRMLIWQAIQNGYTLVSQDADIKLYKSEGLKVVW